MVWVYRALATVKVKLPATVILSASVMLPAVLILTLLKLMPAEVMVPPAVTNATVLVPASTVPLM